MSYIPKYIIKRMFPKNKCLKVVQKDGKQFIQVQMVNILSPIEVPDNLKSEIGDLDLNTAADNLKIAVNGKSIPVTIEGVRNSVELWTQGKGYTLDGILNENQAGGLTLPVGGKITLLIGTDMPGLDFPSLMSGPGDYEVAVEWTGDGPMNIKVKGILSEIDVDFDSTDT
jgi:hypothetical protein